jgi:hypothetical protein
MSEKKGYLNLDMISLKARFIFTRREDQFIREGFDHHLFTSSNCSQTFAGVQALAAAFLYFPKQHLHGGAVNYLLTVNFHFVVKHKW